MDLFDPIIQEDLSEPPVGMSSYVLRVRVLISTKTIPWQKYETEAFQSHLYPVIAKFVVGNLSSDVL